MRAPIFIEPGNFKVAVLQHAHILNNAWPIWYRLISINPAKLYHGASLSVTSGAERCMALMPSEM